MCLSPPAGFRLKHFLQDNETLSSFLLTNASLPENAVQQILEAEINLEKVTTPSARAQSAGHTTATDPASCHPTRSCLEVTLST